MHCRLVNKLIPGYVKKINTKGGNFALMENLAAVQKGMRQYGLPEDELFQPVDLFEARNIKAVVKSLAALARLVSYLITLKLFPSCLVQCQFAAKKCGLSITSYKFSAFKEFVLGLLYNLLS